MYIWLTVKKKLIMTLYKLAIEMISLVEKVQVKVSLVDMVYVYVLWNIIFIYT